MDEGLAWLKDLIRDIPDFPEPGVTFRDITPLLADPKALAEVVKELAARFDEHHVSKVVGIEARGFVFAAPVAVELGAGFVPVRKVGKLPWHVHSEEYALEYGTGTLEVHQDAIGEGERVLIVDDVLATGGTAAAVGRMVDRMGAIAVGGGFVVELAFLDGRSKLGSLDTFSLLTYE